MSRLLTVDEIENIVSFIEPQKGIPLKTAKSIVESTKKDLRLQLSKVSVIPQTIPELKKSIEKMYFSSLIQAGESVGIISAQSFGQQQTQKNLNTFHTAGSADNNTSNIETRFAELLSSTKSKKAKTNTSHIYLTHGNDSIASVRKTVGSSLIDLNLSKIIQKNPDLEAYQICVDKEEEAWYAPFEHLYNNKFRQYKDCISLKINMDILFTYKLTLEQVSHCIEKYSDVACVFSPDCFGQLDVFVDTSCIDLLEKVQLTEETKIPVYLEETVVPDLMKIRVAGIEGISQMFFVKKGDEWMIETDGVNFQKILSHPDFDSTRCLTSNIWDIYETLGIEATRQFMIEQFTEIISGVNRCHSMLLVDRMTSTGTILSISRYTMRKTEGGPFSRCSFEETLKNFMNAGLFGQKEVVDGVSASIICGTRPKNGSGMCSVMFDTSKLIQISKEKKQQEENEFSEY